MKQKISTLAKCPLFIDINESDIENVLGCLSSSVGSYKKNSFIFRTEDKVSAVGIVLSGSVHILQEDFWGNRMILANVGAGELFGEAFSCSEIEKVPISVIAAEPSEILFTDYRKIITTCSNNCEFHIKLIKNMMRILAGKNILQMQKMEILSKRTTREKLLAYLSSQALQAGSSKFSIPFSRQDLADYLCVDRSALSREISSMQSDGILNFNKNNFELL